MLILTRKVGETIMIGDNVCLTIISIESGKIRLGITAPAAVPVDRQEVHERRLKEAAAAAPNDGNPAR
jgi:carbon storage regulator